MLKNFGILPKEVILLIEKQSEGWYNGNKGDAFSPIRIHCKKRKEKL
jgi:hypothetical protein